MQAAASLKALDQHPFVSRLLQHVDLSHDDLRSLNAIIGKRLVLSRPSYGSVGNQVSRAMILHEVTFRDLWETIT